MLTAYRSSRFLVAVLTFLSYTCFHICRKPLSVTKSILKSSYDINNCTSNDSGLCQGWAPFNGSHSNLLLGATDCTFLFTYAIAMYLHGYLADRMNLRYFLTIGMIGSGLGSILLGVAYFADIHVLYYFILVQLGTGAAQAMGWPAVMAVMGRWFGKQRRGLIMGVWNMHTSIGNILGTVIPSIWATCDGPWGWSFVVPGFIIIGVSVPVFLLLVPDPRLTVPSSIQHNVKDTEVEDKITEDSRCIEEEVMELSRKKETVLAGVHSTAADKPKAVGVCAALQIPGVIEYSLALFFTKLVSYTFLFWLPLYISKANGGYIGTRKVSSQLSDWLSVYFDLGGIVGTTLLGGVSDRLGAQAVVVALLLYLSVPILYIYRLFGSTHISVTVVLLVASGMCVNGPLGVITTSVSTDLGTHKSLRRNENAKATVAAIIDGTGSLGAAVGPLIAGAVSEYSWNYSFYFLMSSCLLSGLLLTRLVISDLSQWRCGLSQRNGSKGQFVSYHEVCTLCRAGRPNLVELQHLGSTVEWSSDEFGDVIHPQLWESGSGYETRVAVMSVIGGRAFAGKDCPAVLDCWKESEPLTPGRKTGSGLGSVLIGVAYFANIHVLYYFILVQLAAGAIQSTGWPAVVAILGHWFGKER
ncbi:hypothetical protein EMCRGX_G011390 [Ephydatia muelleri]